MLTAFTLSEGNPALLAVAKFVVSLGAVCRGSSFKTHTITAATWKARTGLFDKSITSNWLWGHSSRKGMYSRIYANNSWH